VLNALSHGPESNADTCAFAAEDVDDSVVLLIRGHEEPCKEPQIGADPTERKVRRVFRLVLGRRNGFPSGQRSDVLVHPKKFLGSYLAFICCKRR
jgi:hypothetical protein